MYRSRLRSGFLAAEVISIGDAHEAMDFRFDSHKVRQVTPALFSLAGSYRLEE